jgi:hypothetical protein
MSIVNHNHNHNHNQSQSQHKKMDVTVRSSHSHTHVHGSGEFIKVSTYLATSDGQNVNVKINNEEYTVENRKPVLKIKKTVEGKLKPENCSLLSDLLS